MQYINPCCISNTFSCLIKRSGYQQVFKLASYALEAYVAVSNSIQFIADKQPKHIYEIGMCLPDTIDFKVQEQQSLNEHLPVAGRTRKFNMRNARYKCRLVSTAFNSFCRNEKTLLGIIFLS